MVAIREAKIILPQAALFGQEEGFHERFTCTLTDCFGGYTMTWCRGGWHDDEGKVQTEDGLIFTIAMEPEQFKKLRAIACGFCIMRGESSVYCVDTEGEVHIVTVMADVVVIPDQDVGEVTNSVIENDPGNCAVSG